MGAEYGSFARRTLSPFAIYVRVNNWRKTPNFRREDLLRANPYIIEKKGRSKIYEREALPGEADVDRGGRQKNSPELENPQHKSLRPWLAWGRAPPSSRYSLLSGLPTFAKGSSLNLYISTYY